MAKHLHAVQRLRSIELATHPAPADLVDPGFRMIGSKVLVLVDDPPTRIGSIHVPLSSQKDPLERTYQATVVAVGPGEAVRTDGTSKGGFAVWKRKPMVVKRGDRVLLNRLVGAKVQRGGVEFYVVELDDVKAVFEFN